MMSSCHIDRFLTIQLEGQKVGLKMGDFHLPIVDMDL